MRRRQVLKGGAVGLGVLAAIHAMPGITPAITAFAGTNADVSEAGTQNPLLYIAAKKVSITDSIKH